MLGLILIVAPAFAVGLVAMFLAGGRGRSRPRWFVLGYLTPVLLFFVVGLLDDITSWGDAVRVLWFGSYFVPLYILWRLPTLRKHVTGETDRPSV